MIDLTIEEFILWLISVPIVMVGVGFVVASLKRRSAVLAAQRSIISCRVCGHMYRDVSKEVDVACPKCGRMNERGRSKRLG